MLEFYQNLPQHIDPIVFSIGSFSIRWYSVMWIAGMSVIYLILYLAIKNNKFSIFNFSAKGGPASGWQFSNNFKLSNDQLQNLFFWLVAGALIGGRLGYVIFYNFSYYIHNPLEVFLPIQVMSYGLQVTGIFGMSYFGGLVGAIVAGYIFARRKNLSFLGLADFVILAVPAGYFFGRIGNFLNGELYGRSTGVPWGMYFSDGGNVLRHPSQLYEAFFEGIVLFLILRVAKNKKYGQRSKVSGQLFMIYVFGYAFFRFFLEFFRQPDFQEGLFFGWMTTGQLLAMMTVLITGLFFILRRLKISIISI